MADDPIPELPGDDEFLAAAMKDVDQTPTDWPAFAREQLAKIEEGKITTQAEAERRPEERQVDETEEAWLQRKPDYEEMDPAEFSHIPEPEPTEGQTEQTPIEDPQVKAIVLEERERIALRLRSLGLQAETRAELKQILDFRDTIVNLLVTGQL